MDKATSRGDIAIGTLQENSKQLNVDDEFLATANSDEGDGIVMLSSMRSTEEGEDITIATNNPDAFEFSLGLDPSSKITGVSGSTFTVSDASSFTKREGLVFYTTGGTTYVARCTRSDNTFTIQDELVADFETNLATDIEVKQSMKRDAARAAEKELDECILSGGTRRDCLGGYNNPKHQ